MMKKYGAAGSVAWVLLLIGGLNWGLIGLGRLMGGAGWDVVNKILGSMPVLESVVYLLVGVSAVMAFLGSKSHNGV